MATSEYKFYMQKVDKDGNSLGDAKDLEKDFAGLRYAKAKGINDIGKQRTYTETYVESDKVNVYIPDTPTYDVTSIDLTLYFIGNDRYNTYNAFNDFIKVGFTKYWDTARNREFIFYIDDKITIGDELWYGSTPYLEITYKLQNIKGYTEEHK